MCSCASALTRAVLMAIRIISYTLYAFTMCFLDPESHAPAAACDRASACMNVCVCSCVCVLANNRFKQFHPDDNYEPTVTTAI